MSIDVRRLTTDGEFEQYLQAAVYAFNSERDGTQIERYRRLYERDWCLGAFDGGRLVAGLALIPFEQHMEGRRIPLGGIATVASLPERRREGHVGALLRRALVEMRDAGTPVSGLYTPHASLYRRFGWEVAHRLVSYAFAPKAVAPRLPRPRGTYRRVSADAWPELEALRSPFVSSRNGALARREMRWRGHVFSDFLKGQHDGVIWSNADGEARGYAVYAQQRRPTGGPWGTTTLRVYDWLALDGEAYAALLAYLLGHDLVDEVVLVAGEGEPLAAALGEPDLMETPSRLWQGALLRVVDVAGAFASRRAGAERGGPVTLRVHDQSAPWNDGTWRMEASGGEIRAEKADAAEADIVLDAVALGPLFNGFMRPEEAVQAGLMRPAQPDAVRELHSMLRVDFAPHCPDDY